MKKKMISMTVISLILSFVSGGMYFFTNKKVILSAAITFGTIFYHLAMRLAVGFLVNARYHNRMDYTKRWFQEKAFEKRFYQKLRVRKWKKRLPTLEPQNFDLKNRSVKEIIQASCQAEVVHEINMPLSFVPVLFSIWFGSLDVFVVTSCLSVLFDSLFVILQRYNRPRLIRLLKRQ